jgi:hypothetical protein
VLCHEIVTCLITYYKEVYLRVARVCSNETKKRRRKKQRELREKQGKDDAITQVQNELGREMGRIERVETMEKKRKRHPTAKIRYEAKWIANQFLKKEEE